MLKYAHESDPHAWWWIKGDGVDVVKGLKESTVGLWSGDADLNDGNLVTLRRMYEQRMKAAAKIGLEDRATNSIIESDLKDSIEELQNDLTFIHSGEL